MKKSKAILFSLGLCFMGWIMIVSFQTPERTYTITLPEQYVNSFYQIVNGNADNISVGEYKQITALVNSQLIQQNKSYALQDSIAAVKNKVDSTKKK